MNQNESRIHDTIEIIKQLGFPRQQQNERTALCLLALLGLKPENDWSDAKAHLIGITPIMKWVENEYSVHYEPNTRETFRRQSMHQFVEAGVALLNPDDPTRPINSPKNVYQIEPSTLELLKEVGSENWEICLQTYLSNKTTLIDKYAKAREINNIPVQIAPGQSINLSPGDHSQLIKDIIEVFAPHYIPNSELIYAGDTGNKWGYFDQEKLEALGVIVGAHGKMPDVVLYYPEKNWLILAESVTSHGPVDGKRYDELSKLFEKSTAGIVYVTAFPDKAIMRKYLADIAWETEVWVADAPTHLIHFNGVRFLGPYN